MRLGTRSHPSGHSHSQVGCLAPLVGRLWAGSLLQRLCFEVCLTLLLHGLLQMLLGACALMLTKAVRSAGNAGKRLGSRQIQVQGLLQGRKRLLSDTMCAAEHKCHAKLNAITQGVARHSSMQPALPILSVRRAASLGFPRCPLMPNSGPHLQVCLPQRCQSLGAVGRLMQDLEAIPGVRQP